MPTCALPSDPNLEHLKSQAKSLQRRVRSADPEAVELVREFHPRVGAATPAEMIRFSRADAQLVVARQYGFASWSRLRRHLDVVTRYARSPHRQPVGEPLATHADRVDEFLRLACLTYGGDDPTRWQRARDLLAADSELATASIHTMAAVGEVAAARALLDADPSQARREGGPHDWEPLLYSAYSRLDSTGPGHSTLDVARLLLDHGADPNAGYLWEGLSPPFTALTGAFGGGEGDPPPHQHATQLARLLLDRGADPNDSQTLYNRGPGGSTADDTAHLELLLAYGLGTGSGGPWHARLAPGHPTPAQLLQDELVVAAARNWPRRARLVIDHGVDVHGRGTAHPVFEGHTAYELATLNSSREVLELLVGAGVGPEAADPTLSLLGACMRADRPAVEQLLAADPALADRAIARRPHHIVTAAEKGRLDAVRLMADLGFDVNIIRRTAPRNAPLHEAAWNGNLAMVRLLVARGADPTQLDGSYHATPLAWAEHNHQQEVAAYLTTLLP